MELNLSDLRDFINLFYLLIQFDNWMKFYQISVFCRIFTKFFIFGPIMQVLATWGFSELLELSFLLTYNDRFSELSSSFISHY